MSATWMCHYIYNVECTSTSHSKKKPNKNTTRKPKYKIKTTKIE